MAQDLGGPARLSMDTRWGFEVLHQPGGNLGAALHEWDVANSGQDDSLEGAGEFLRDLLACGRRIDAIQFIRSQGLHYRPLRSCQRSLVEPT